MNPSARVDALKRALKSPHTSPSEFQLLSACWRCQDAAQYLRAATEAAEVTDPVLAAELAALGADMQRCAVRATDSYWRAVNQPLALVR